MTGGSLSSCMWLSRLLTLLYRLLLISFGVTLLSGIIPGAITPPC